MDKVAKYVQSKMDFIDIEIYEKKIGQEGFEYFNKTSLSISSSAEGYLGVLGVIPHSKYIKFDKQNANKLIAFLKTIK